MGINYYDRQFWISYRLDGIDDARYLLLIDLDNEGGDYPHALDQSGEGIVLTGVAASLYKTAIADQWIVRMGIVYAVTASDCTIGWLSRGTNLLMDTGKNQSEPAVEVAPALMDVGVSGGSARAGATSYEETVADLDTTSKKAPDFRGVDRFVAPGDLLLRTELPAGSPSGTLTLDYLVEYFVR